MNQGVLSPGTRMGRPLQQHFPHVTLNFDLSPWPQKMT